MFCSGHLICAISKNWLLKILFEIISSQTSLTQGNGNYNAGKTLRHQHLKWTLDFDFEDENGNMDEGKDNDDYDDLDSNPQSR